MTVGGFLTTILATTSANIISFLIYQGAVHTGWFKGITVHLTEELNKLNPKAEKKYRYKEGD